MALEQHNSALDLDADFEPMLRRHLARGGSTVTACTGFDFDLASAYLESALSGAARTRYDAHLAGCPACRRHVIELSRLTQSLSASPATGPTVIKQGAVTQSWKAALTVWWQDLAERFSPGWQWQTWGMAGAALAVVLGISGLTVWRQMSSERANLAAVTTQSVPQAGVLASSSPDLLNPASQPSTPEASPAFVGANTATAQPGVPRPRVDVTPQASLPQEDLAVTMRDRGPVNGNPTLAIAPGASAASNFSFSARSTEALPPAAPSGLIAAVPGRPVPVRMESVPSPSGAEEVIVSAPPDNNARLTPSPSDNPMLKRKSPERRPAWADRVMGFLPQNNASAERKTESVKEDDESLKPITTRIQDKVFRFERGVWIDQEYKPTLMSWRVLKLNRGSKEYEQVLAAEPQLKEFFSHGPMLLVWKNKIYKVVGK